MIHNWILLESVKHCLGFPLFCFCLLHEGDAKETHMKDAFVFKCHMHKGGVAEKYISATPKNILNIYFTDQFPNSLYQFIDDGTNPVFPFGWLHI